MTETVARTVGRESMALTLPVDRQGRLARMMRLPGYPEALAFVFGVGGKVDRERLAEALALIAGSRHPVAGCRLSPHLGLFYRWRKVPFDPDATLRGPYESPAAFDLFRGPPIRVHVGGETLAFEISHVAFDAIGLTRLVRSVLEQYEALPRHLPVGLDEEALRWSGEYFGPIPGRAAPNPGRIFRDPVSGEVLARRADPVARTGAGRAAGTFHHHLALQLPRVKERARDLGCTVNDLLVSALLTQVVRWNGERGAPARFLSVDVPANLRPPERPLDLAANASSHLTANVVRPAGAGASLADLLGPVSAEIRRAKGENRHWWGIRRRATLRYPMEATVRIGTRMLGGFEPHLLDHAPTALVSNYGRIPGMLGDFAGLDLHGLRVEGSAFSPLTVNAVSPDDATCMLCFCVRRSLFTPETLAGFAGGVGRIAVEGG